MKGHSPIKMYPDKPASILLDVILSIEFCYAILGSAYDISIIPLFSVCFHNNQMGLKTISWHEILSYNFITQGSKLSPFFIRGYLVIGRPMPKFAIYGNGQMNAGFTVGVSVWANVF